MPNSFKIISKFFLVSSGVLIAFSSAISNTETCKRPPNLYNFNTVECLTEGFSKVEKDGNYGLVNFEGHILVPAKYEEVSNFSEGVASYQQAGQVFFIDTSGKVIFPVDTSMDVLSSFNESMLIVKQNKTGLIGFMNKSGKIIIPFQYANVSDFKEGLAAVMPDNSSYRWGFINKSGKFVIQPKYSAVGDFSEGLASVESNGKWGFVDKLGIIKVPIIYDYVSNFKDNVATVDANGQLLKIDKAGKPIR